jgi:jumonji domain-containing protein 2
MFHDERQPNVFYPTFSEMSNFVDYVEFARQQCEPLGYGLCRIVPPKEYKARQNYDTIERNLKIPSVYHQSAQRHKRLAHQGSIVLRANISTGPGMSFNEYKSKGRIQSDKDIETNFWKYLDRRTTVYASDLDVKTLFDPSVTLWNLNHLETILTKIQTPLLGVNTTFLYVANPMTFFAMHVEDFNLPSINYLHLGQPKLWYSVPSCDAHKVNSFLESVYPHDRRKCPSFIRHKRYLIHPKTLENLDITVTKTVQNVNEFIVTFPEAYHQGFNFGYNIAEAINFATPHWIPYGKRASACKCVDNSVVLDMSLF